MLYTLGAMPSALRLQPLREIRVPELLFVIPDGNGKRLLCPDEDDQFLGPGNRRIEEISLEQKIMLGTHWDNHCRILTSLRLMDRDGIGER